MKKIKIISFVLAMLFLFYAIPMNIYAEFDGETEEKEEVAPSGIGLNAEGEEVFWVEDIHLRTESSKTFHLSDGTSVLCDYGTVVHHKLEYDTLWRAFSNNLEEYDTDYMSEDMRVRFQKKITGNETIYTVKSEAGKITLALLGANKKTQGVVLPSVKNEENADEMTPNAFLKLSSTTGGIVYRDILEYVDIEYILSDANVKENIYLKQKDAQNSFTFEMKLNGMCALLDDKGNICIYSVIETVVTEDETPTETLPEEENTTEVEEETVSEDEVETEAEENKAEENDTVEEILPEVSQSTEEEIAAESLMEETAEEAEIETEAEVETEAEIGTEVEDTVADTTENTDEETEKVITTIGSLVYVIPAPIVYDAAGKVADSTASWYTLESENNGKYTFTVTVDRAFLDAEDTVYPVVIDPTLSPVMSETVEKIKQSDTISNVIEEKVEILGNSVYYWKNASLPSIATPENIISATLTYRYFNAKPYALGVSAVTNENGAFEDAIIDFNQDMKHTCRISPECIEEHGQDIDHTCPTDPVCPVEHALSFDITDIVQDWYLGNRTNYGVALHNMDEATLNRTDVLLNLYTAKSTLKPSMTVIYRNPMGIEPYYSYFSHSLVNNTAGYVNYANGALTNTHTLFNISTPFASCPISLVYDSNLAGKPVNAPNINAPEFGYTLPDGFFLSVSETIIKSTYMNSEGTLSFYYIYRDADGTEHCFYDFDGDHQFTDEDGLGFTLYFGDEIACIEAQDKSTRVFDLRENAGSGTYWCAYHLSWVLDEKNNGVYLELGPDNRGRVDVIYSVIGANVTRELDSDKITAVSEYGAAKKQEEVRLFYSGPDLHLQSVVSPWEKSAYLLEYDEQGKFSAITKYYSEIYQTANTWDDYFNYDPDLSNPCIPASEQMTPPSMTASISHQYTYTLNSTGYLTEVNEYTCALDTFYKYRSVKYSWSNQKVSSIREYGKNTLGDSVSFTYYDGKTEVTSHNVTSIYAYDRAGRVVLTYSLDNEHNIIGATTGSYSTQEGAENKLASTFQQDNLSLSYLENGKFFSGLSHWNTSGVVTVENTKPSVNYEGYSVMLRSGSISQMTTLSSGEYVLAFFVHSRAAGGLNARVNVILGDTEPGSLPLLTKEIPLNPSAEETDPYYVYFPFSVADDDSTVTIIIACEETDVASADAYFAISSVALGHDMYSTYDSLVEFGTFEERQDSVGSVRSYEDRWTDKENDNNSSTYADDYYFGNSLRLMGEFGKTNVVTQTVYTAPSELLEKYGTSNEIRNSDTDFVLHAFGKATEAFNNSTAYFGLLVNVHYYQGAAKKDEIYSLSIPFSTDTAEWQFVLEKIDVPSEKDSNESTDYSVISKIEVSAVYSNQPGRTNNSANNYALFDNIYFGKGEDAETFEYKDGLVVHAESGDDSAGYVYGRYDLTHANWTSSGDMVFCFYEGLSTLVKAELTCRFTTSADEGENRFTKFDEILEKDNTGTPTENEVTLNIIPTALTTYTYNSQGQTLTSTSYSVDGEETQTVPSEVLNIWTIDLLLSFLGAEESVSSKGVVSTIEYYDNTTRLYGFEKRERDTLGNSYLYLYDEQTTRPLAIVNEADRTAEVYEYNTEGVLVNVHSAVYTQSDTLVSSNKESVDYSYNQYKELSKITTNSTEYQFTYNNFGDATKVVAGDRTLAQYTYDPNTHLLLVMTYGNGTRVNYNYDNLDRLTEVWYTESGSTSKLAYRYTYQANGAIATYEDYINGEIHSYTYDVSGRLIATISEKEVRDENGDVTGMVATSTQSITYDIYDRITQTKTHVYHSFANNALVRDYTYSSERGILESVETTLGATTITEGYTVDNLGRLTNNTISLNDSLSFAYGYTYTETATTTSGQISTVTVQGTDEEGNITNSTYTYTYDGMGNITTIVKAVAGADDEEYRYYYDSQGQLIRENNSVIGRTYIYAYDNAGNLLRKEEYAYSEDVMGGLLDTVYYTYADNKHWGDLLTKYDGQTITYDTIGNPLSYYNGQRYTFTWAQGRRLATAALNGVNMSFLYDDQGLRTQKVVGDTTITYTWSGTTLLSEATDNYILIYLYDENASPIGFQYKTATTTETYLYEKNLQGDIVAVYSEAGVKLISYAYDAWGNANISLHNSGENTNATKNPFTYRGYYYDQDLGLYYLQSRYYDAKVGRFISADALGYLGANGDLNSYNLYAYCSNNPVMYFDQSGHKPEWISNLLIVGAGVLLIAGLAVATVATGGTAAGIAGAIFAGALKGALIGATIGTIAGGAVGYAVEGNDGMWTGMAIGFTCGAVVGAMIGGTVGATNYSPLQAASNAANKAIPAKGFNINKHLSSASGNWSKFNKNSADDILRMVQDGLKGQNVSFAPNGPHSWKVIVDMGTQIGTKGQNAVKVIIGHGGKIWTMYPV